MVIEFQILLYNFKASKKVNVIKTYLFQLLGMYFINDTMHLMMLTPNKRQWGENEWIMIRSQTRKMIKSKNPLKT